VCSQEQNRTREVTSGRILYLITFLMAAVTSPRLYIDEINRHSVEKVAGLTGIHEHGAWRQ